MPLKYDFMLGELPKECILAMGIGGAPEIKTELFGIHSIFCWYSLSCAVMGKVCALLWVACALLTTGLPSLTGGCGITAIVTLMDGTVETADETRTLALVGEEVTRVEIWCRNAPPPHSIFHDDTVVFRTSSNSPRFVMTGFGLAEQGAYRCDCSGGGNKLNLLRKFFHCAGCGVECVERARVTHFLCSRCVCVCTCVGLWLHIKELALATCIVLTTSPDVADVLSGVRQHVLKLGTYIPVP